jgi:hypothetical protein
MVFVLFNPLSTTSMFMCIVSFHVLDTADAMNRLRCRNGLTPIPIRDGLCLVEVFLQYGPEHVSKEFAEKYG